jgi:6,7-dimethyl-8-ribityllumazine synthase
MPAHEIEGRLRPAGRVAIVASRFNEIVTRRLLEGARACCAQAGIEADRVDVAWVAGAFELPVAAAAAAATGRYACVVALGAVIRGETPHFEYVAGEATRGLGRVALEYRIPVGFGLLTVDTLEQALARAGGEAGNKGFEAAEAALTTSDAIAQLRNGRNAAD